MREQTARAHGGGLMTDQPQKGREGMSEHRSLRTDALKPCPFCDGGATVSADMTDFPQIACDACGASGPGTKGEKGIQAATDAWNRRAQPSPREVALEKALRGLLVVVETVGLTGHPSVDAKIERRIDAAKAALRGGQEGE